MESYLSANRVVYLLLNKSEILNITFKHEIKCVQQSETNKTRTEMTFYEVLVSTLDGMIYLADSFKVPYMKYH